MVGPGDVCTAIVGTRSAAFWSSWAESHAFEEGGEGGDVCSNHHSASLKDGVLVMGCHDLDFPWEVLFCSPMLCKAGLVLQEQDKLQEGSWNSTCRYPTSWG